MAMVFKLIKSNMSGNQLSVICLVFYTFGVAVKCDINPKDVYDIVVKGSFCDRKLKECDIDPDAYLNTAQIIRRHGYPAESHIVETDDGYLLTLHRIPGSKNGKRGGQPIFLQHGLLSSSSDWFLNGNESLGFLLADRGYDVWLGNARGNTYSTGHVNYSIHSAEFWNFSWHEMGTFDLPAALYFISNATNKPGEIIYVGHSMGTTMYFVLSSLLPQVAKTVKLMVALAPVAYMTHLKSPIRYLAPFVNDFEWIEKHLGINDFLPSSKVTKFLAYDCMLLKIDETICRNIVFALCGFDKQEFNEQVLDVVLAHDPAGTSTKAVLHYAQEIKESGSFQQYDYGPQGNMIKYGRLTPPFYPLDKIKRPMYIMYANNDLLASPIDVKRLAANITSLVGAYLIPFDAFNHVDFLFGKDAPEMVYKPLLKMISNFTEY